MGFIKGVGDFFSKEVPKLVTKTVPKVVTKDVPKFFTETLPGVTKKETYAPDLVRSRERAEARKAQLDRNSTIFFETRTRLENTRAEYERLAEEFTNSTVERPELSRLLSDKGWKTIPSTDIGKVLKDTENTVRYVLKFFTLDLTELIWMPNEIKKEREHLAKQNAALKAANAKLDRAISEMKAMEAELATRIAELKAFFAEQGLEEGTAASELQAVQAESDTRRAMARRLLGDGVPPADIAFVTGLPVEDIAALDPDEDALEAPEDMAADLAAEGLDADEISALGIKPAA
ncbi:MAG: hypothetical protein AAGE80_05150 [Pseudomonadota bacterium]